MVGTCQLVFNHHAGVIRHVPAHQVCPEVANPLLPRLKGQL